MPVSCIIPGEYFGQVPDDSEIAKVLQPYRRQDLLELAGQMAAVNQLDWTFSAKVGRQIRCKHLHPLDGRVSPRLVRWFNEEARHSEAPERFTKHSRFHALALAYLAYRYAHGNLRIDDTKYLPDELIQKVYGIVDDSVPRPAEAVSGEERNIEWFYRCNQFASSIEYYEAAAVPAMTQYLTKSVDLATEGAEFAAWSLAYALMCQLMVDSRDDRALLITRLEQPLDSEDDVWRRVLPQQPEFSEATSFLEFTKQVENHPIIALDGHTWVILDPIALRSKVIRKGCEFIEHTNRNRLDGEGLEQIVMRGMQGKVGFTRKPNEGSEKRKSPECIYKRGSMAVIIEAKSLLTQSASCLITPKTNGGGMISQIKKAACQIAEGIHCHLEHDSRVDKFVPVIVTWHDEPSVFVKIDRFKSYLTGHLIGGLEKNGVSAKVGSSGVIECKRNGRRIRIAQPRMENPFFVNLVLNHLSEGPPELMPKLFRQSIGANGAIDLRRIYPKLPKQNEDVFTLLARLAQAVHPEEFRRRNPGGIEQFLTEAKARATGTAM